MIIVKKAITTEKSYNRQDNGIWTFLVSFRANKSQIKRAIEKLFGVPVASVNTSPLRKKTRRIGQSRQHTKRQADKIARITLADKKQKIDLTKVNK